MTRVLVGESVFEEADLDIFGDYLWVEFESDDLDSIAIPIEVIGRVFSAATRDLLDAFTTGHGSAVPPKDSDRSQVGRGGGAER